MYNIYIYMYIYIFPCHILPLLLFYICLSNFYPSNTQMNYLKYVLRSLNVNFNTIQNNNMI